MDNQLHIPPGEVELRGGASLDVVETQGAPTFRRELPTFQWRLAIGERLNYHFPLGLSGWLVRDNGFEIAAFLSLAALGQTPVSQSASFHSSVTISKELRPNLRILGQFEFWWSMRYIENPTGEERFEPFIRPVARGTGGLLWQPTERLLISPGLSIGIGGNYNLYYPGITTSERNPTWLKVGSWARGGHPQPLIQFRIWQGLFAFGSSSFALKFNDTNAWGHHHVAGLGLYF